MKGILFRPDVWTAKKRVLDQYGEAVTRRVVKFLNVDDHRVYKYVYPHPGGGFSFQDFPSPSGIADPVCKTGKMPRYHLDEVVYVKEAYMVNKEYDHLKPSEIPELGRTVAIWYWADGNHYLDKVSQGAGKVRSPMFLKEVYARHFLQITGVRAERLQAITLEDCKAEGMQPYLNEDDWEGKSYIQKYAKLWDSINKEHQWADNPWVWRYEFKWVERPTEVK